MDEKLKEMVQKTVDVYKDYIPPEKLKRNYLHRPPVKFILFLFNEVMTKTGFGVGLMDDDMLQLSKLRKPLGKVQKMDFLTRLINFVGLCLRKPIPVYPNKIAAGKQVDKTNMLLQAYARCATRNKSEGKYKHWENAVRMIKNGENQDMTGKAYEKLKTKKEEEMKKRKMAEAEEEAPPPVPKPAKEDGGGNDQPTEEELQKQKMMHEEKMRRQKQEEIERLRQEKRKQEMERKLKKEQKERKEEEERRRRLQEAEEMATRNMQSPGMGEASNPSETDSMSGEDHDDSMEPVVRRGGGSMRPTSRKATREIRHVGDGGVITRHITESTEDIVNYEQVDPTRDGEDGRYAGMREEIDPTVGGTGRYDYAEQPIPTPGQVGAGRGLEDEASDEEVDDDEEHSKGGEHGSYVFTQARHDHRRNHRTEVDPKDGALTQKLMGGIDSEEMESKPSESKRKMNESQARRKKIVFGDKKTRGRGKDHVSDIEFVRKGIQGVCNSTNPLGKSMDFIQEDLDSMKMELKKWRSMSFKYGNVLNQEKRSTDQELKSAKDKIFDVNQQIENVVRKIYNAKAEILRNEKKMEDLLKNVVN